MKKPKMDRVFRKKFCLEMAKLHYKHGGNWSYWLGLWVEIDV